MEEAPANRPLGRSLHICPACDSRLVQPTSWEQGADRTRWRVWRRCPECGWAGNDVHGEVAVDAYDEELDLGANELADELRSLERANMNEMAETFILALRQDLVGPEDFRV